MQNLVLIDRTLQFGNNTLSQLSSSQLTCKLMFGACYCRPSPNGFSSDFGSEDQQMSEQLMREMLEEPDQVK